MEFVLNLFPYGLASKFIPPTEIDHYLSELICVENYCNQNAKLI